MKRLFLVAAVAAGAVGCADDLRPIQIRNAQPLTAACAREDVALYAGRLDLAPLMALDIPVAYRLSFTVASMLETEGLQVSEGQVADSSRNNFIAESLEFRFTSQPAGTFVAESIPAYLVVAAGVQDTLINVNLIPPRTMQTVRALVDTVPPGQEVQLISRFRIKGRLASGVAAESDEAAFPISVFRSEFSGCPAGQVLQFDGPCGQVGGQNGQPIRCAASSSSTP